MGMGKTLQVLSLIMFHAPRVEDASPVTLVVCPVSAMATWVTQVDKHIKAGYLKYCIYTGMVPELVKNSQPSPTHPSSQSLSFSFRSKSVWAYCGYRQWSIQCRLCFVWYFALGL